MVRRIEEGKTYTGTVTGTARFGAFVTLPDGSTGLVHISELSDGYVKRVQDVVEKGDEIPVLVVERGEEKTALSLRRSGRPQKSVKPDFQEAPAAELEEKMEAFLEDSRKQLDELDSRLRTRQSRSWVQEQQTENPPGGQR
ncbi:S1 RNA-binding domain-containing protein [Alkalicoccus chagannorensis]|uniref:S1 RNA-binding domain-containing protein n=1 Tax=Alkalicoccus chagannorensis TaxID=427072 RepID=UPI00040D4AFD|nr:S1 RNA-binding domain-containing protein [Alkalicoccus chagannorensis]